MLLLLSFNWIVSNCYTTFLQHHHCQKYSKSPVNWDGMFNVNFILHVKGTQLLRNIFDFNITSTTNSMIVFLEQFICYSTKDNGSFEVCISPFPLLIKMFAWLSVRPKSWDGDIFQIRNSRREGVMNGWMAGCIHVHVLTQTLGKGTLRGWVLMET